MALTSNLPFAQRAGTGFGYNVAAGIHVYAGALLMFNSAMTLQRIQDTGGVAFAGVALRELDNSANSAASTALLVAERGIVVKLPVSGAVAANIGAAVYATDDATATLSSASGANPQIGFLAGFEGGSTWVRIMP
jgi:hypothetical protein